MGSGFDDWGYWQFFTIKVDYNSSQIELLLNVVYPSNLYEESQTDLYYSRIHECAAFYNCHAAEIGVTM
jgi:hypothetical protein